MLPITTLENDTLILRPLQAGDWKLLTAYNKVPDMWTYFPIDMSADTAFANWMEQKVEAAKSGSWYPFLVILKKTNAPIGLSCYLNVDEVNLGLEIGGTWYGAPYHGTEVNPNAKLLLLTYAFETLRYERVEFKTDVLNARSRRAIEKLGAKQDGVLRSNRIVQQNRRRDTVYYSILKDEWPSVKANLIQRINQQP